MKSADNSAADINLLQQQFLAKPHNTAKLYIAAKSLWEKENLNSTTNSIDRWSFLMSYKILLKSGKERAFGTEIIATLRKHLAKIQGNRCCYCRRWLQNIAYARPVDHILSRSDYPQFSLSYWNLTLCCKDCNQLKSKKNWSSIPLTVTTYPTTVSDFFHPRIHIFDMHIRYVRVETNDSSIAIYHGLTEQGRRLCRDHLKTISQVDGLMHNNPRIATAMAKLQLAGADINPLASVSLNEFIEQLHAAALRIATGIK